MSTLIGIIGVDRPRHRPARVCAGSARRCATCVPSSARRSGQLTVPSERSRRPFPPGGDRTAPSGRSQDRSLREEIKASTAPSGRRSRRATALREEMKAGDHALREEMNATDATIREEMRAGFAVRMVDIGAAVGSSKDVLEQPQPAPGQAAGGRRLGSGVCACHLGSRLLAGDLGPPDGRIPVRRVPLTDRWYVACQSSLLDLLAGHQLGESVALIVRRRDGAS